MFLPFLARSSAIVSVPVWSFLDGPLGVVLGELPGVGLGELLGDVLGDHPGVGLVALPGVVPVLVILCLVLDLAFLGLGLLEVVVLLGAALGLVLQLLVPPCSCYWVGP